MTKKETISGLKEIYRRVCIEDDMWRSVSKLNKQVQNAKNGKYFSDEQLNKIKNPRGTTHSIIFDGVIMSIVYGIGFGILGFIVALVVSLILTIIDINANIKSIIAIIIICIAILIGFGTNIVEFKDKKRKNIKKYDEAVKQNQNLSYQKANLSKYEAEYESAKRNHFNYLQETNAYINKVGIHREYCKPQCLKAIVSLLEHGRADTLKEAINLYLAEEREIQRDIENTAFQRQQMAMEKQRLAEAQRTADAQERLAAAEEETARSLSNINRIESWKEFEEDIGLRKK